MNFSMTRQEKVDLLVWVTVVNVIPQSIQVDSC